MDKIVWDKSKPKIWLLKIPLSPLFNVGDAARKILGVFNIDLGG